MLADLVEVKTSEGILLSGAYFPPAKKVIPLAVDSVLFFHGDGGNFYSPLYLELGKHISENGIAFLSANRRGHDQVSNGPPDGSLAGYAFESVADSKSDFSAWLELLQTKGHHRTVIGGHSGGAVRAVYSQSMMNFGNVIGVISASPGEYNHQGIVDLHGEDFLGPYRESKKKMADHFSDDFLRPGIPWGSMWTAQTFVDCFNTDNRYSVTAHTASIRCPTLFIFGSEECAIDGPQELPVCGKARRNIEASQFPHVTVQIIDGANHSYVNRYDELHDIVFTWLRKLKK